MAARRCSPPESVASARSAQSFTSMRASAPCTICTSPALSPRSQPMCGWRPSSAASNTDSGSASSRSCGRNASRRAISPRPQLRGAAAAGATCPAAAGRRPGQGVEREALAAAVAAEHRDELARAAARTKDPRAAGAHPALTRNPSALSNAAPISACPADFARAHRPDEHLRKVVGHLLTIRAERHAAGHDFRQALRIARDAERLGVPGRVQGCAFAGVFIGGPEGVQQFVRGHDGILAVLRVGRKQSARRPSVHAAGPRNAAAPAPALDRGTPGTSAICGGREPRADGPGSGSSAVAGSTAGARTRRLVRGQHRRWRG